MSGRGSGYCAGYDGPGYASNPWGKRGFGGGYGFGRRWGGGRGGGFGWGRGMGWRWGSGGYGYPAVGDPYSYPDPEDEMKLLREESKYLEKELKLIKHRIEELTKSELDED